MRELLQCGWCGEPVMDGNGSMRYGVFGHGRCTGHQKSKLTLKDRILILFGKAKLCPYCKNGLIVSEWYIGGACAECATKLDERQNLRSDNQ